MFLIYELTQSGASHAPFTRSFLTMVANAYPGRKMILYAQKSHLDCALNEPDPIVDACLTTQVFIKNNGNRNEFWKEFMATLWLLNKTYRLWRRHKPQVIFLTGHPQHIFAAKLFKYFNPAFRCQLVLHGDVNSVRLPRARNPFHRATDYFSSIAHANNTDVRILALETHIRANLAATIPDSGNFIDAIHHPCVPLDIDLNDFTQPQGVLRFGLLGIAGRSKGLDVFAQLASQCRTSCGPAADFRVIGKLQRDCLNLDLSGISGPRPFSQEWLPRQVFETELKNLHYVVLPYNMNYYGLSASGVLLDVLRWRKPIISFETPVIRELIEQFGDIGTICANQNQMFDVINNLCSSPFDDKRYQAQRRNLDAAYRSRLPESVAIEYTQIQSKFKN